MQINYSGHIRPITYKLFAVQAVIDSSIIWLLFKQMSINSGWQDAGSHDVTGVIAIILYNVISIFNTAHKSFRLQNLTKIIFNTASTWIMTLACLTLISLLTNYFPIKPIEILVKWGVSVMIMLSMGRLILFLLLRRIRSNGNNFRNFIIFGEVSDAKKLLEKINGMPWSGLRCSGIFDDIETAIKQIQENPPDYIFIAFSNKKEDHYREVVKNLSNSTASIYIVPNIFINDIFGSSISLFGNMPIVTIYDHPFYGTMNIVKRIEDIIFSSIILLLIFPLLILISICIKCTSPGPIFFIQKRYGLNGKIINVIKFRTMTNSRSHNLVDQVSRNDSRVTKIGKFLRKTSLDELPQFINVISGEMSIVGPRPHPIPLNEHFRPLIDGYMTRHKVKPGITGLAQINGFRGGTETFDKMQSRIDCDLNYIRNWSFYLDLKIICITIFKGWGGNNSY